MSNTLMQIINQRALVAALTEFGERLGAQLGDACPRDTFQLALNECLKDIPQQKVKATKAAKLPNKAEVKKAALKEELEQLGGIIPEDDSLIVIRKAVSNRKKEIKAEENAVKAEKTKQAKLLLSAEKKKNKKESPNSNEYTARRLNDSSGVAIPGVNGSACRVKIHKKSREVLKVKEDNWTDECNARFAILYPNGNSVEKVKISKKINNEKKKITKKVMKSADEKLEIEQKALISAMVSDAVGDKLEAPVTAPVTAPVVAPVTAPVVTPVVAPVVAPVTASVVAPVVAPVEEELDEIEEEEIEEDVELEEEELEEDTPEFPGEESIEEFEHVDLAQYVGVDFYVDEDTNVWDEHMTFVGKYNEDEDTLNITEGYEPLDDDE